MPVNTSGWLRTCGGTGNKSMPIPCIEERDLFVEPLDSRLRLIFIISYVAIIVLAVGGNLLVFLVVAGNRKLRTVTNTFILSLAVSDMLIASLNMPVQLLYYIQNGWNLGNVMCKLTKYLQGVVIVSSILTLTGIAIDRYYAICYPLRARHVHTVSRAVRLVTIFWLIALTVVSPQLAIQRIEPYIVAQYRPPSLPPSDRRVRSSNVTFNNNAFTKLEQLQDIDSQSSTAVHQFGLLNAQFIQGNTRNSTNASSLTVPTLSGSVGPFITLSYSCNEYFRSHLLNVIYTLFTYCVVYVIPVVVMLVAYATIAVELQRTCRGTVVVVADRRRRRLLLTMAPHSTTPQSRSHVTTLEHDNVSSLTNESYLTTSGVQVQHSNDVIETMTSPVTTSEVERQRRLRDRRVIVRMLVAIVLLFAVSWFPFFTLQVYTLWDDTAHRRQWSRVLMGVVQLLGYSNSATNSFVYCWFSENFQKHIVRDTLARIIRHIICCCRKPRLPPAIVTSRHVRWPIPAASWDPTTGCQTLHMQTHHVTSAQCNARL